MAKLRTLKTNKNLLLLKCNMDAGHGGASGRYDRLREVAYEYAFMLDQMGDQGVIRFGRLAEPRLPTAGGKGGQAYTAYRMVKPTAALIGLVEVRDDGVRLGEPHSLTVFSATRRLRGYAIIQQLRHPNEWRPFGWYDSSDPATAGRSPSFGMGQRNHSRCPPRRGSGLKVRAISTDRISP